MHLTDRQMDRFFDLLDGLIMFANTRLHLVDSLSLPIVGEEAEMKAAYVCDTMWRHPGVVEEYVRLNPNGLRKADLDAIAAWKDALIGRFTLVRFERDWMRVVEAIPALRSVAFSHLRGFSLVAQRAQVYRMVMETGTPEV